MGYEPSSVFCAEGRIPHCMPSDGGRPRVETHRSKYDPFQLQDPSRPRGQIAWQTDYRLNVLIWVTPPRSLTAFVDYCSDHNDERCILSQDIRSKKSQAASVQTAQWMIE